MVIQLEQNSVSSCVGLRLRRTRSSDGRFKKHMQICTVEGRLKSDNLDGGSRIILKYVLRKHNSGNMDLFKFDHT